MATLENLNTKEANTVALALVDAEWNRGIACLRWLAEHGLMARLDLDADIAKKFLLALVDAGPNGLRCLQEFLTTDMLKGIDTAEALELLGAPYEEQGM